MNSTEQSILSEIVAQHLERRLGQTVERRANLSDSSFAFQTVQGRQVDVYVDSTGTLVSEILRETPADDASAILERARGELRRTGQVEVLNPLGFENPTTLVIRSSDQRAATTNTLSDAAKVKMGWRLGVSYAFQQRNDGTPALNAYKLPMAAPPRGMDTPLLFPALDRSEVTMITASATDGALSNKAYKALIDDQHHFSVQQGVIVVRQDSLARVPALRSALDQLSGKFTSEKMREMNQQVESRRHTAQEVAAEFLKGAGL